MKKTEFINEMKGKSVRELHQQAQALSEELMKMRFKKVTGQVEQPHRFKVVRRNLARVKTMITKANSGAKAK